MVELTIKVKNLPLPGQLILNIVSNCPDNFYLLFQVHYPNSCKPLVQISELSDKTLALIMLQIQYVRTYIHG